MAVQVAALLEAIKVSLVTVCTAAAVHVSPLEHRRFRAFLSSMIDFKVSW